MSDLPLPQDWKDEPLSTLVERLESGVSVNSEDKPCAPDEFGILKTSCVNGGKFDPSQNKVIVANEVVRAALNPRADSVLISRMNTFDLVGETAYVGGDFPNLFVPDRLWQTVIRGGLETSTKWLSFVVQSPGFRAGVSRAATGTSGSMKNISQGSYLAIRTHIPPPRQQRRIAEILTTVDEAMEATEALVLKLEQMKAGLMHDLFTRGVTPDGHLRPTRQEAPHLYHQTPLGWLPKEWEADLLDKLSERGSGHTPDRHRPDFWNGGIKWVSLADSWRLDRLYISETDKEISNAGIANSSAVLHPPGIVVLSRDAGVGKSAITTSSMAVSQHFMCWRCGPNLDNHFLYYWLQSQKRIFENIATGTTIPTIGLRFFKHYRIAAPLDVKEQQRIGSILQSTDANIFALEDDLAKLRQQKQGLMQDLLTGRVPLKA